MSADIFICHAGKTGVLLESSRLRPGLLLNHVVGEPPTAKGYLFKISSSVKVGRPHTGEETASKAKDGLCSQELKIVHTGLHISEPQSGRYFLERFVCQTVMSVLDKTNVSLSSSVRTDDNEETMYMGRGYMKSLYP